MTQPLLEVRDLTKHFGGVKAVDNFSYTVDRGGIVALIGPNGAGKTTTFNLLTGFIRPDGGRVIFNGEDITGKPPHVLAQRGLVRTFQTAKMFGSMTVREMVITAALLRDSRKAAAEATDRILEQLNLAGKRDRSGSELSLPDRQLVELAKCMAMRPKMVLLDEIMGGLNRAECDVPIDAIRRLRDSGITFMLVEHVMPIVMSLAEHIAVLDFGRKIAEGTPGEVVIHPEVQKSYLGVKA